MSDMQKASTVKRRSVKVRFALQESERAIPRNYIISVARRDRSVDGLDEAKEVILALADAFHEEDRRRAAEEFEQMRAQSLAAAEARRVAREAKRAKESAQVKPPAVAAQLPVDGAFSEVRDIVVKSSAAFA